MKKKSSPPNLRKHDRYEYLVAIDYDVSDYKYQCFLRDIFLGGVYIETDQTSIDF